MGDFIPSGSGESAKPLYLRDSSLGDQGPKGELGRGAQLVVGIVVETDEGGFVIKTRDGVLQPRNWHESESDEPISSDFPSLKDRRYSVALIADHENGFGSIVYPNDRANPFLSDWPFAQRSTRLVDGDDPKGHTAIFAQMCKIIDDLNSQYTAAWPFKRTSGTEDDSIATGYLWDAEQGIAALMDCVLTANPSDLVGHGTDGTPVVKASIRHDAIFTHVDESDGNSHDDAHGPLALETTDAAAVAEGSTLSGGTEYQGKLKWNSTKKLWVPTFWASSGGGGGGGGSSGPTWYGDGSDGDLVLDADGVSGYASTHANQFNKGAFSISSDWGEYGNGSGNVADGTWVYRPHRPLFCRNLTIEAGALLVGTYIIMVSDTLTINGEISISGGTCSIVHGLVGGGFLGGESEGGAGGAAVTAGNGLGGGDPADGYGHDQGSTLAMQSGAGGAGGGHSSGGGWGSDKRPDDPFLGSNSWSGDYPMRMMPQAIAGIAFTPVQYYRVGGGTGGGSGGAGSDLSGAGGRGGGSMCIRAKTIVGSGRITADGGNGGRAIAIGGGGAGGGGGGNGGVISLAFDSMDPGITPSVVPGLKGKGINGGSDGTAGGASGYLQINGIAQ